MTGKRKYRCAGESCAEVFEAPPVMFDGRDIMTVRRCPACVEKWEAEQNAGTAPAELDESWNSICPPLYRENDLKRLPDALTTAASEWTGERWLGFTGQAGAGKTRAAYIALRRMHYAGKDCCAITGTQLRRLLSDAYADDPSDRAEARSTIKAIRSCRFLLLDDLGKQRFTEAAQEDVFDLLETRAAHLRPIIWTTNSSRAELANRLSADRSNAIIRRLAEFSDITKF
jgi:hypothetical protein